MNAERGKSFVYITPFLNEIQRIKDSAKIDIYDPKHRGSGKLEDFNELLSSGENVVSTHSLFSRITSETRDYIQQGHYTLILDEVLDVINIYDGLKKDDIRLLFENNLVTMDEDGYLVWNEEKSYPESRFSDVQLLAQNRSLIYVGDTVLMWNFPVKSFELFEHVYILTYQFSGQLMRAYYDYHNVEYEYKSVINESGKYDLAPYCPQSENRLIYKDLINIIRNERLNSIGDRHTALSKNWFERKKKIDRSTIVLLKNNLTNYFKHKLQAKSDTIMWSTYKDYQPLLSDRGRVHTRQLTTDEKKAKPESLRHLQCFVPCNARATNTYADRYNLAYTVNLFINPLIVGFFKSRKIYLDEDKYALCEMLQWIWRSRIRNMQPINIYIPSRRMRDLLEGWISSNGAVEPSAFQTEKKVS